jgi:hypothetical protein
MPTILIVANQTLGGEALTECIEKRRRLGPCSFYVVVPATPPKEHLTWTEGEARAIPAGRVVAVAEAQPAGPNRPALRAPGRSRRRRTVPRVTGPPRVRRTSARSW